MVVIYSDAANAVDGQQHVRKNGSGSFRPTLEVEPYQKKEELSDAAA